MDRLDGRGELVGQPLGADGLDGQPVDHGLHVAPWVAQTACGTGMGTVRLGASSDRTASSVAARFR